MLMEILYRWVNALKHLIFFYLTFSYSISLFSLAVMILAYMKSKLKSLVYWIVFVASGTLPLLFLTYLDYRYANIPYWFSGYHDVINYLLQSLAIFTLPMLVNVIFEVKNRKPVEIVFGTLLLTAMGLIVTPYLRGYLNNGTEIETLIFFKMYTIIVGIAYTYTFVVFLYKIKSIGHSQDRRFYILSAFFAMVIFSQGIVPVFKTFPEDMLIYAACVFFWNIFFIRYAVARFFKESEFLSQNSSETIIANLNLTEREKEILLLLVQGMQNKDIGGKLFISEGTVKTHIQNIYKKLGVRNRVQLFNLLKGEIVS